MIVYKYLFMAVSVCQVFPTKIFKNKRLYFLVIKRFFKAHR